MSNDPIASCLLKNDLTLVCTDQSKKMAADRWHIRVVVDISIPVDEKWFGKDSFDAVSFEQISSVLGPEITFRRIKERFFVSDEQRSRIVKEICDRVINTGLEYCGSSNFASKYILKAYHERIKGR